MIIDTHVHFGEPSRPHELLYRTELPSAYEQVAIPHGITGVIHSETLGGLEENRWILDLAASNPMIRGMVGSLQPASPEFAGHLDEFAASPLFCGVRVHHLEAGFADGGSGYLRNLEMLADADRALDIHLEYQYYEQVLALARRLPQLRLVLNHIGEGRPITGAGPNAEWARTMGRIADHPNVFCKVSALVQMTETVPAPTDPDFYAPVIDVLWEAFGADRLLFASNWPQIEEVSDFATAFDIVDQYFSGKGAEAREKYFCRNSKSAYKWADRS